MEEEPKRLQATPEEFERLLRGETVNLSLEGGKEHSCLKKQNRVDNVPKDEVEVIEVRNLEVSEGVQLTQSYNREICFLGDTKTGNLTISENADIKALVICGKARTGDVKLSESSKIRDLLIEGDAEVGNLNIWNKANLGKCWVHGNAIIGDLSFNNDVNIGEIKIYDRATTGFFSFSNSATVLSLKIADQAEVRSIDISGRVTLKKEIDFSGGSVLGKINFHNWKADHIHIKGLGAKLSS